MDEPTGGIGPEAQPETRSSEPEGRTRNNDSNLSIVSQCLHYIKESPGRPGDFARKADRFGWRWPLDELDLHPVPRWTPRPSGRGGIAWSSRRVVPETTAVRPWYGVHPNGQNGLNRPNEI